MMDMVSQPVVLFRKSQIKINDYIETNKIFSSHDWMSNSNQLIIDSQNLWPSQQPNRNLCAVGEESIIEFRYIPRNHYDKEVPKSTKSRMHCSYHSCRYQIAVNSNNLCISYIVILINRNHYFVISDRYEQLKYIYYATIIAIIINK